MKIHQIFVLSCGLAGAAVVGCGSDKSTPKEDGPNLMDAGSDAASADASSTDSTLASACKGFRAFVSSCKSSDTCSVATARDCEKYIGLYSDGFIEGMAACSSASCSSHTGSCIADHEDSLPTTAVQNRIRDEYCKVCPSNCDTFFDISQTSAHPDRNDGQGAVIRHAGDEVAATIEKACIPSLTPPLCGLFFGCTLNTINPRWAPQECQEEDTPDDAGSTSDGGSSDAASPDAG